MKVALYVGDHAGDTALVRAGWYLTRKVQKGPYSLVTHVESIHADHADGSVTIASASLREGGVREKRVTLTAKNWWIVDVPAWDVNLSIAHFEKTKGMPYDTRGAVATVFLGSQDAQKWFCNEWCGDPFINASGTFCPAQFTAIALTLGHRLM